MWITFTFKKTTRTCSWILKFNIEKSFFPSYPGTTITSHLYGEVCGIQERNFAVVEETVTLIQGVITVKKTAMFGNFRKRMQNKIDGAMWLYALTHKFVQNNIKVIACFSEENKHDINWNLTFMILKTLALVNIWRQLPKCLYQSFVFLHSVNGERNGRTIGTIYCFASRVVNSNQLYNKVECIHFSIMHLIWLGCCFDCMLILKPCSNSISLIYEGAQGVTWICCSTVTVSLGLINNLGENQLWKIWVNLDSLLGF